MRPADRDILADPVREDWDAFTQRPPTHRRALPDRSLRTAPDACPMTIALSINEKYPERHGSNRSGRVRLR